MNMNMNMNNISKLLTNHFDANDSIHAQVLLLAQLRQHTNELLNVVPFGCYNAAKSSLLNMLTGHVQDAFFPCADVPTTRQLKSLTVANTCYIDTPGLDVNTQDSQQATLGFYQADLVLLVHKLTSGPLQQAIAEQFKQLLTIHSSENVLLVLTAAESVPQHEAALAEIKQQLSQLSSQPIDTYMVSNTLFKKGTLEQKDKLIELSGVPKLQQVIATKVDQMQRQLAQIKQQKQQQLEQLILDQIDAKQSQVKYKIKRNKQAQSKQTQQLVKQVTLCQQQLNQIFNQYTAN